jgi:hypothetical protein
MTAPGVAGPAVTDPIGLIADLVVAAAGDQLTRAQITVVAAAVAGGRAKSRRLAMALNARPGILADGRSPAPRAAGDLLLALRRAGARTVSPPCCAGCDKPLRTLQRRGQDWYCSACIGHSTKPCAACGRIRQVSSRDRAGRPRCVKCPDIDGRDSVSVIHQLILRLDPATTRQVVATAVRACTPQPAYQQKLAWALEEQPGLLTGQGHLAPLRAIPRLIEQLHAAGVAGIVRPACPRCQRVVRIDKPLDGVRVCRRCLARSRTEPCSGCGAHREPVTRTGDGQPLCANCFITDPVNLQTCLHCGRHRRVGHRTPDGPLCPSCPPLPVLTCSICGDTRPCGISRVTGQPWCPTCQHRTADCSACGCHASVASGTLAVPLCGNCTAPAAWTGCPTCADPDQPHPGQCARCLISKRLDELMGPDTAPLPPGLRVLRTSIATTEHPVTAMRWLTKPSLAPVLSGLATGQIPLTHQGLDELPASQPLAHLRQTLVAVGALPERDEVMVALQAFVTGLVTAQHDREHKNLLHRYLIWHLLRRLRARNNGQPTTRQQSLMVRRLAHGALAFLDWLHPRGLTLATFSQADLDHWATDPAATYRTEAGRLIRWARTERLTTVHAPAARGNGPAQILDHQHRWDIAHRLLHDQDVKPEDRLAGLLVLLYAQGVTAINQMKVTQVDADTNAVRLRLGRVPIHLPEPVAALARAVLAHRKGHATIGVLTPSPWLFPGGQPGRPISSPRLTQRLNHIGIHPSQDRSTALFQLATEVPAAILARTLGIHTNVAVTWQRHSAGDWTTYAADISRRQPTHSESWNI